jgi:hypothetical protein
MAHTVGNGTASFAQGVTVSRTGAGQYTYTLDAPLPDANYPLVITPDATIGAKTATGFSVSFGADTAHSVIVASDTGLPAGVSGGSGAAFGEFSVNAEGELLLTFVGDSVQASDFTINPDGTLSVTT